MHISEVGDNYSVPGLFQYVRSNLTREENEALTDSILEGLLHEETELAAGCSFAPFNGVIFPEVPVDKIRPLIQAWVDEYGIPDMKRRVGRPKAPKREKPKTRRGRPPKNTSDVINPKETAAEIVKTESRGHPKLKKALVVFEPYKEPIGEREEMAKQKSLHEEIKEYLWIPTSVLKIDHTYQRMEVSKSNTARIADNFSWNAFQTITVAERSNGEFYVIDGQQRLLAARKRNVKTVPCEVLKSNGVEHEALMFKNINECRRSVSSVSKFNSAVAAGMELQTEIHRWLKSVGLSVTQNNKVIKGIIFPTVVVESWTLNKEACKKALLAQRSIDESKPLVGSIHRGLSWLERNGVNTAEHVEKLKRMGGQSVILREIHSYSIETGKKANDAISGRAILRLINKNKHNKIVIETDGDAS